jgi:hypothetical protein
MCLCSDGPESQFAVDALDVNSLPRRTEGEDFNAEKLR